MKTLLVYIAITYATTGALFLFYLLKAKEIEEDQDN